MSCFCGNAVSFEQCCQPIIEKNHSAKTAEELMRSRYSAYCIKDGTYIYNTYANEKRADNQVSDIQQWADETKWLSLQVKEINLGNEQYDFVEFIATYIANNEIWQLHEKSRFIKEGDQWCYLDGEIIAHTKCKSLTRNSACPCESGLKYKRCCMN